MKFEHLKSYEELEEVINLVHTLSIKDNSDNFTFTFNRDYTLLFKRLSHGCNVILEFGTTIYLVITLSTNSTINTNPFADLYVTTDKAYNNYVDMYLNKNASNEISLYISSNTHTISLDTIDESLFSLLLNYDHKILSINTDIFKKFYSNRNDMIYNKTQLRFYHKSPPNGLSILMDGIKKYLDSLNKC